MVAWPLGTLSGCAVHPFCQVFTCPLKLPTFIPCHILRESGEAPSAALNRAKGQAWQEPGRWEDVRGGHRGCRRVTPRDRRTDRRLPPATGVQCHRVKIAPLNGLQAWSPGSGVRGALCCGSGGKPAELGRLFQGFGLCQADCCLEVSVPLPGSTPVSLFLIFLGVYVGSHPEVLGTDSWLCVQGYSWLGGSADHRGYQGLNPGLLRQGKCPPLFS